jgi:hypothetical protein
MVSIDRQPPVQCHHWHGGNTGDRTRSVPGFDSSGISGGLLSEDATGGVRAILELRNCEEKFLGMRRARAEAFENQVGVGYAATNNRAHGTTVNNSARPVDLAST